MNFSAYLIGKNIDPEAFEKAEPALYRAWSHEFEQLHPNSFTVQKLNLINPIRRKYKLPDTQLAKAPPKPEAPKPAIAKPALAKPAIHKPPAPAPTGTGATADPQPATASPASGEASNEAAAAPPKAQPKPAIPRPVIRPKPKTE